MPDLAPLPDIGDFLNDTPPVIADEAVAATDDAGLVEAIGAVVHTVAGDERSLKVTRPLDLSLAQLLAGQERLD